jgi:hypothetical protein
MTRETLLLLLLLLLLAGKQQWQWRQRVPSALGNPGSSH